MREQQRGRERKECESQRQIAERRLTEPLREQKQIRAVSVPTICMATQRSMVFARASTHPQGTNPNSRASAAINQRFMGQ